MTDELRALIEAIESFQAKHDDGPEIAVTPEFRRRLIRLVGGDENEPVAMAETVFGEPMVIDYELPLTVDFVVREKGSGR